MFNEMIYYNTLKECVEIQSLRTHSSDFENILQANCSRIPDDIFEMESFLKNWINILDFGETIYNPIRGSNLSSYSYS